MPPKKRSKAATAINVGADLSEIDKLVQEAGLAEIRFAAEEDRVARIPSRIHGLNLITGGGYPRGRMTEIFGKEGSYKSGLLLDAIASVQMEGGEALLIETENTFDPDWAATNGVDIDRLRICHPERGEDAYSIMKFYLASGKMDLIGIDSLANVVPGAELDGQISDATIGLQARLNAKAMRNLTAMLNRYNRTALIFINQVRGNIAPGGYGPSETTTGGKALPYYMSLRLKTRRTEWVQTSGQITGARYEAEIIKAKLHGAVPRGSVSFEVDATRGLDFAADILQLALQQELVKKSGAWFNLPDGQKVQGEYAMKQHIWDNLPNWRAIVGLTNNA